MHRPLVVRGLGSFAAKVLQAISGLVVGVILARLLTPGDVGAYGIIGSIIAILSIPIQAGVARFLLREVARANIRSEFRRVSSLISWARGLVYFYAASVVLLILFIGMFLPSELSAKLSYLYMAFPAYVLTLFIRVDAGALVGLQNPVAAQSVDLVRNVIIMLFLVAIYYCIGRLNLMAALLILGAGAASANLITRLQLSRYTRDASRLEDGIRCLRGVLPYLVIGSVSVLVARLDIILIGVISGRVEAGFFLIASQFAGLILFGLSSLQVTVAPHFIRYSGNGNMRDLKRLLKISMICSATFGAICLILLWAFGPTIIGALYGKNYSEVNEIILVLSAAYLIQSCGGIYTSLLSTTGHEGKTLRSVLLASFVKLAIAPVLIFFYGATGAAISLIAFSFTLAVSQSYYAKHLIRAYDNRVDTSLGFSSM